MSRAMPLAGDYAAAVQNPGFCFTDEVLRGSVIRKNNLGQPRAMSGQFSVVFPVTSPDGARHAVKCFTHDAPNQLHRYELIYQELSRLRPRWATDFAYLEDGIRVEAEAYPVLRLDWVEGTSLLTWLGEHRDARDIAQLAGEFDRLIRELADAGIAHGDLQHGNILVQRDGSLRLIDYDGIYLPGIGLEEYPSDETGLPDYQPPSRTAADYGPAMDRFSAWLISLSLHALASDPALLDALNPERGEYLLLDREDFADPWFSDRMQALEAHADPRVRELADRVRILLTLPLTRMPDPVAAWSYDGPAPERPPQPVAPRKPVKPPWLAGARLARPRRMPSADSYAEAVRRPRNCFTDDILRETLIWKDREGQPRVMRGRFSVVFSATTPDSKRYAVKCFTRDVPDRGHRYWLIADGLTNSGLRHWWSVDFDYIRDGIQVDGESYPVLQMDWVEGVTLLEWIDAHPDPGFLAHLADQFLRLIKNLAAAGIAHGDLRPGNIIVRRDGSLRLIDYDGMYLPGVGLEQYPPDETGSPDFQPPTRTAADYGPAMDRFSAWLILLSLKALTQDPSLLDLLNRSRGEYLLLSRDDFADPKSSRSMTLLDRHWSLEARQLAMRVRTLLGLPLSKMPDPAEKWPDPSQRAQRKSSPPRPYEPWPRQASSTPNYRLNPDQAAFLILVALVGIILYLIAVNVNGVH